MTLNPKIPDAWKRYNAYVSKIGDIVACKYCGHDIISDEADTHLKKYHPRQANETLWLILSRLEWEDKQLTT